MAHKVFITAAEVSGDLHASHVIRCLREPFAVQLLRRVEEVRDIHADVVARCALLGQKSCSLGWAVEVGLGVRIRDLRQHGVSRRNA